MALAVACVTVSGVATPTAVASLPGVNGAARADAHVARRPVGARAAAALRPTGELRGIVLNDQNVTGRALLASAADFPRMAAEGITSVSVYVFLYVANPRGTVVTTGPNTPTDAELQLLAQAAHASGLDIHLMPVLNDTATNSWRGTYVPSNTAAFFASYRPRILHYADLARSIGATLFYVGSENRYLERATSHWQALIVAVRKHYSGALSYLAIPATFLQITWWNSLDLAAVSPYFSMGVDPLPSYERDVAAWNTVHSATVARFVKAVRVPVIYGEAGFNSQKGSFSEPAAAASPVGTPAPAAQADAYRALLDVLARNRGVYGVSWWRWNAGSTVADMGWSPVNKPAECVLAAYWSQDAKVRNLASQPVCDLHALDATLAAIPVGTLR